LYIDFIKEASLISNFNIGPINEGIVIHDETASSLTALTTLIQPLSLPFIHTQKRKNHLTK